MSKRLQYILADDDPPQPSRDEIFALLVVPLVTFSLVLLAFAFTWSTTASSSHPAARAGEQTILR
jgi:hypothetical protein